MSIKSAAQPVLGAVRVKQTSLSQRAVPLGPDAVQFRAIEQDLAGLVEPYHQHDDRVGRADAEQASAAPDGAGSAADAIKPDLSLLTS